MPGRSNKNAKGFSLIEIIVVLLIMSALGVLGTTAIVHMIGSYQLAKDNARLTQKAQVAMTRISSELNYATTVSVNNNVIRYAAVYPDGTTSTNNRIGVQGGGGGGGGQTDLKISKAPALPQGYTLADNVTAFNVTEPNDHLVAIELRMQGENGIEQTFTTAIAYR